MTRPCRHDGCARPAERHRTQCRGCRARQEAARNPQPRAWGPADETDVELIIESPRPVDGLSNLERVLIARGIGHDMTAEEIARVVGVSPRTVYRWRTRPPARAQLAA